MLAAGYWRAQPAPGPLSTWAARHRHPSWPQLRIALRRSQDPVRIGIGALAPEGSDGLPHVTATGVVDGNMGRPRRPKPQQSPTAFRSPDLP